MEGAGAVWRTTGRFTLADLSNPDIVFQIGIEPNRIDILMGVEGLDFQQAWGNRVTGKYEDQRIFVLGYEDTVHAKKASGREQDLLDARRLEAARKKKHKS